jgi:O-antigen ligase
MDRAPVSAATARRFGRALVATLAWGVLSFGAVYAWAYWPLAIACAALGVWGVAATHAWRDRRTRHIAWASGAVALAIVVQLVAVPYAWLSVLSPGVDRFLRAYQLAYHPAAVHPLSIDPASTAAILALFVAFVLFLLGVTRTVRAIGLDWLATQLMGLGVGLAVVGVVQRAFAVPDDPLVYGFWRPQQGGMPFGPFVNRNHFAGWMVMALPVVLGYTCAVLQTSRRSPRSSAWREALHRMTTVDANRIVLLAVAGLVMGMSLALTGSRSGVASFAVAVAVLGYFVLRRMTAGAPRWLLVSGLLVLLAASLGWAGLDRTMDRFGRAPAELEGRFSAWRDTRHIIADFPVFGTGLGTYARAMLLYQTQGRDVMYAEAHNDYLQIVAEGGLVVGLPILVLAGVIALTIRRRLASDDDDEMTSWIRIGSVAGLAGIAAQSLVEFSLQMPGNAAMFVLLLAIALHRPSRRSLDAHRV